MLFQFEIYNIYMYCNLYILYCDINLYILIQLHTYTASYLQEYLNYHLSVTSHGVILGIACQWSRFDADTLPAADRLPCCLSWETGRWDNTCCTYPKWLQTGINAALTAPKLNLFIFHSGPSPRNMSVSVICVQVARQGALFYSYSKDESLNPQLPELCYYLLWDLNYL